jgi:hypothetical protein
MYLGGRRIPVSKFNSECIPRLILGELEGRKWRKKEQAVKSVFSKWMLMEGR